jgi:hypothetical protein
MTGFYAQKKVVEFSPEKMFSLAPGPAPGRILAGPSGGRLDQAGAQRTSTLAGGSARDQNIPAVRRTVRSSARPHRTDRRTIRPALRHRRTYGRTSSRATSNGQISSHI